MLQKTKAPQGRLLGGLFSAPYDSPGWPRIAPPSIRGRAEQKKVTPDRPGKSRSKQVLFHIQNDRFFPTELSPWSLPPRSLRHTVGRAPGPGFEADRARRQGRVDSVRRPAQRECSQGALPCGFEPAAPKKSILDSWVGHKRPGVTQRTVRSLTRHIRPSCCLREKGLCPLEESPDPQCIFHPNNRLNLPPIRSLSLPLLT